jgi:hypothetical protein
MSNLKDPESRDLVVQNAINITENNQPISNVELANIAGFTKKEIRMLETFWQPAFNKSWIYLSDDIIKTYLTNETGKDALQNFYKRVLIPYYEKDFDYKQVSKDNELVNSYSSKMKSEKSRLPKMVGEKSRSPKMKSEKNNKAPHNKKYYIVSGECYKSLLMSSRTDAGRETRNYFIKVEKLAQHMRDYITYINIRIKDVEIKKIEDKYQKTLKRKKRTVYEKGNVVYIVSHIRDKNRYKFGEATQTKRENDKDFKSNISNSAFKSTNSNSAFTSRMSVYNTSSPTDFEVEALYYIEQNKLIEKCIEARFVENLNPLNKEWIEGVSLDEIKEYIKKQCDLSNFDYKEVINKKESVRKERREKLLKKDVRRYEEVLGKIESYTYRDLEDILKEFGLKQKGPKKDKLERLEEFLTKKLNGDIEEEKKEEEEKEEKEEEEETEPEEVSIRVNGRMSPREFDKFMEDYCEVGSSYFVPKADVRNAYRIWTNSKDTENKRLFFLYLKSKFKTRKKIVGESYVEVYSGFRMKKLVYSMSSSKKDFEKFIISEECGIGYQNRVAFSDFFDSFVSWKQRENVNFKMNKPEKTDVKELLLNVFASGRVHTFSDKKSNALMGIYGLGLKKNNYGLKGYEDRKQVVYEYDSNTNEILNKYPSRIIACKSLDISMSTLNNNISNRRVINGRYFK